VVAVALRLWNLDRLPPGLHYDEAVNGSDVRMVLEGRGLPLYFDANSGREPLFIYLQALSAALLGATPLALRFTSAWIGILTIPLTFLGVRILLIDDLSAPADRSGDWIALVAAAGMAVSYWHVSLSRLGFRAILLPLFSLLAMAFFWRAWIAGRKRDYMIAGACLALALYSYTSARLLPLAVLLFLVTEAALGRRTGASWVREGQHWRGLAWLAGVLLLLSLPLAVSFWHHPYLLTQRTQGISLLAVIERCDECAPWQPLIDNLVAVLRSFYDRGDGNWRHNLAGRPVNDLWLACLFTLGWLTSLVGLRKARYRLLLIWFGVALLPTVLSEQAPHMLRASGALPALVMLVAAGAQTLLGWIPSHKGRSAFAWVLLFATLLIGGGQTARDYFQRWGAAPQTGGAFDLVKQLAAQRLAELMADRTRSVAILMPAAMAAQPHIVYALGLLPQTAALPADLPPPPTWHFMLDASLDEDEPWQLLWQEGGLRGMTYVKPVSMTNRELRAQLIEHAATQQITWPGATTDWPQLTAGQLPAQVTLQPDPIRYPLRARFANGIQLLGYNITPDRLDQKETGRSFRLTLFWEVAPGATSGPVGFVHLTDGHSVWQTRNLELPQDMLFPWLTTARVIQDSRQITVPLAMPDGKAYFEVGLYQHTGASAEQVQRIDVLGADGRPVADRVDLAPVRVGPAPASQPPQDLHPLGIEFVNAVELLGWSARPAAQQSEQLQLRLAWRTHDRMLADYTAFVHVLDAKGQIIAQMDRPPGDASSPTSRWIPDEIVVTEMTLSLPPGLVAEATRLRVGLYEPASGRQLPITASTSPESGRAGDTFVLLPPH
jgi:4-amino-4-deoxy-L-arabinose transferase-like glycosyltransferase